VQRFALTHTLFLFYSTATCTPTLDPTYTCTVVNGRMRIFLSDSESVDEATSVVLQNIQTAFQSEGFVETVGSGLMKIDFIPDDGNNDESAAENDTDNEKPVNGNSSNGTVTSLMFVAVGSAALVIAVGSVYLWRRRANSEQDGMVTQFAGSSMNQSESLDDCDTRYTPRPSSPLSQMIPGSYRLGDNTSILSNANMSPVYELENDSASVVVSESGYSNEAGLTDGGDSSEAGTAEDTYGSSMLASKYDSSGTPDFLGAKPRPGMHVGDLDMEAPSDSELDTSGEMSPVKMFVLGGGTTSGGMLENMDSPASNLEDDALLFDEMEEQKEVEEEKETQQEYSAANTQNYNNDETANNSKSPAQTSDIFTVDGSPDTLPSPDMEDIDLEEGS